MPTNTADLVPPLDYGPDAEPPRELIFDPADPLPTARWFVGQQFTHPGGPTLLHDGDEFHSWTGAKWQPFAEAAIRAFGYAALEPAKRWSVGQKESKLVPFAPNQSRMNHFVDAVRALTYDGRQAPAWLCDLDRLPDPSQVLAAPNGLIHLRPDATAELFEEPSPLFFSPNALDFPFDAAAPAPRAWLAFLASVWPNDPEAVGTLQEWFGYCLLPDTRHQKALLLVGPKRGGKGTIARILARLLGLANVCGPTLSGLGT